jgi:hypothetical protein
MSAAMSETIQIRPSKLRQFGASRDREFCLVTNKEYLDVLKIVPDADYTAYRTIEYSAKMNFEEMLGGEISEAAHILVVSPDVFFRSPREPYLKKHQKLMAMACNSTPTNSDNLRHFLRMLELTDPADQQQMTDRFFEIGQQSKYLTLIDPDYGTALHFNHLNDDYQWNEQTGFIDEGHQQLAPAGEISVLPLNIYYFDGSLHLDMEGDIAIRSYPVLHCGTPSYTLDDQARIYEALSALERGAVIASVKKGVITDLSLADEAARPAYDMLNCMFKVDSRYRRIWELGFAVNRGLELYPGNAAMNEVYGGPNGTIHLGLGLTPYTQYHLDLISPHIEVRTSDDQLLHGGVSHPTKVMNRVRSAACPCVE